MLVPQLLLHTLERLRNDDFKTFKWHLSLEAPDSWRPIPTSRLEDASRIETVSRMMESYGNELAVNVAVEILSRMNINDCAASLKAACAERKTAATSTPSSALPTSAAPATLSAQHGGVIANPSITGSTIGTVNINITKP